MLLHYPSHPITLPMNCLEITPASVQLKGLARTGEFRVRNRNQLLAAAYEVQVEGEEEGQWSVFPEKGILMRGQEQRIRVKLGGSQVLGGLFQHTECSLGEVRTTIQLRHTFKTDYNRHYMQTNQIRGWSKLAKQEPSIQIEVTASQEKQAIEQYIKEEVVFAKTFAPEEVDISAIEQREKTVVDDGIESKAGEKKWLEEASHEQDIVLETNRQSDDFNTLKFGESRSGSFAGVTPVRRFQRPEYEEVESMIISPHAQPIDMSQAYQPSPVSSRSLHTVNLSSFGNLSSPRLDGNRNRSLQLIILAVIAAFFCALGSNMARVFG